MSRKSLWGAWLPGGCDDTALLDEPLIKDALPRTIKLFENLSPDVLWTFAPGVPLLRLKRREFIHEQTIVFSDWRPRRYEEGGDGDRERQVGGQMQGRRTIVHPVQRKVLIEVVLLFVQERRRSGRAKAIAGEIVH